MGQAYPFVKWAGGKRQLLSELVSRLPYFINCYHEPFVGGGALFFELANTRRLKYAYLSDVNDKLIDVYQAIKSNVDEVIKKLRMFVNNESCYYIVRAMTHSELPLPMRAARFIYLNKTCFNGLYRENRKGEFNVPFGKYRNPKLCDEDNLREVSKVLKQFTSDEGIQCRSFETVLDRVQKGDFVYFDPPYHPVSKTSNFTSYSKNSFGPKDQERLRDVFKELQYKGVKAMLSNSDCTVIRNLYQDFRIEQVFATRPINSKGGGRGKIPELIITNY